MLLKLENAVTKQTSSFKKYNNTLTGAAIEEIVGMNWTVVGNFSSIHQNSRLMSFLGSRSSLPRDQNQDVSYVKQ